MTANPTWPTIEDAWSPSAGAASEAVSTDQWVALPNRVIGTAASTVGRQYETDQMQAGEYRAQLDNNDGALDPNNLAGPWAGHVQLMARWRRRAQYPATVNLLTPVQATGGDLGGYSPGPIPAGAAIASNADNSGGTITPSGTAWQGSNVLQFTIASSSPSGREACFTAQPALEPGSTYTVQLQVRNVTPSSSLGVRAHIEWFDATGTSIRADTGSSASLTGGSAAWTPVVATGTAPANTAYAWVGVRLAGASPGVPVVLQVDGWQLERGASATAWGVPGTWYPVAAGFADQMPQTWGGSGSSVWSSIALTCYDTFGLLSRVPILDPLPQEITSRNPRFLYALDDPQGSDRVADSAGNLPPAVLAVSKYGAGSLALGTQVTATDPVNGVYAGSTGTVAELANPNPGTATLSAATFIDLHAAGIKGPAGGTWSRMVAFRYTGPLPTAGAFATIWAGFGSYYTTLPIPAGSVVTAVIDHNGNVQVQLDDDGSNGDTNVLTGTNVHDGNWHLLLFGATAGATFASIDGNYSGGPSSYATQSTLVVDNLGAWQDVSAGKGTYWNFQGDLALAAEFPAYLTSTDCATLYAAWKTAFAGDSSDVRYARILGWAGYTGRTSLQAGLTRSMGPAAANASALAALQDVVTTENGNHFVTRDGVVTFKSRADRYNNTVSTYTFGENTAAGEWPYEPGITVELDMTRVGNIYDVTAASGQVFSARDKPSIAMYGPRKGTRTVNTTSAAEAQDATNYLVSRYRQPQQRISAITLRPATNPGLWPVCLSLELGMRVTVNRRTPWGTTISQPSIIEHIQSDVTDAVDARWQLELSPVDATPYGVLAAFHTTLAAPVSIGDTAITIRAGADNTNPARAQLGSLQQLLIEPGTAGQETATIAVGGVPVTSPGWSTCTLNLPAPITIAHPAGAVVCERLPAGVSDPTTWDSVGRFDSAAFAY